VWFTLFPSALSRLFRCAAFTCRCLSRPCLFFSTSSRKLAQTSFCQLRTTKGGPPLVFHSLPACCFFFSLPLLPFREMRLPIRRPEASSSESIRYRAISCPCYRFFPFTSTLNPTCGVPLASPPYPPLPFPTMELM